MCNSNNENNTNNESLMSEVEVDNEPIMSEVEYYTLLTEEENNIINNNNIANNTNDELLMTIPELFDVVRRCIENVMENQDDDNKILTEEKYHQMCRFMDG